MRVHLLICLLAACGGATAPTESIGSTTSEPTRVAPVLSSPDFSIVGVMGSAGPDALAKKAPADFQLPVAPRDGDQPMVYMKEGLSLPSADGAKVRAVAMGVYACSDEAETFLRISVIGDAKSLRLLAVAAPGHGECEPARPEFVGLGPWVQNLVSQSAKKAGKLPWFNPQRDAYLPDNLGAMVAGRMAAAVDKSFELLKSAKGSYRVTRVGEVRSLVEADGAIHAFEINTTSHGELQLQTIEYQGPLTP